MNISKKKELIKIVLQISKQVRKKLLMID